MNKRESYLGLFSLNLALLIGLGVFVSWWLLYFTNLFPAIGGFLGLGGVLAWAAFVSGLITQERKQELQHAFEGRILLSRKTTGVLLILGLVFAGIFSFFGSVEVGAIRDSVNRTVAVYAGTDTKRRLREVFLPARGSARFALPTRWLGSRTYRLKVSGLPSTELEIHAWSRQSVTVPDTFVSQPVLLLWPSASIANQLRAVLSESAQARLTLRLYGAAGTEEVAVQRTFEEYAGESIWVGFDTNYELPQDVVERWHRTTVRPTVVERWLSPLVASGVHLAPGQRLEALLEFAYDQETSPENYTEIITETISIKAVIRQSDLPQREVLDGK